MKNVKQILGIVVLNAILISASGCKEDKSNAGKSEMENAAHSEMSTQNTVPEFKDASVASTFQHYLHLKTALVNGDMAEAKKGAQMMVEVTKDLKIKTIAYSIAEAEDIKKQREVLSELTTALKPLLVEHITSGEIYEQHCPMALNGGANWFAVEKEVNNPYYGDAMLHCGVVQETLK
ncbi:DUF3347 domain-containing protein [Formosa sp. S-31]|uniref:DUF3347 domain-containing protein n=1 Tax=Formosa sp. S-31 TaxID=2790949 RepID=UPI003EB90CA5